ncbi:hypothetical protein [Algirhabdus cladophorae]|uniref:hypothetical protein n=1 Tax=Algirhabdus cladophorae TaxID=3377108 RepID=UPI003B84620B
MTLLFRHHVVSSDFEQYFNIAKKLDLGPSELLSLSLENTLKIGTDDRSGKPMLQPSVFQKFTQTRPEAGSIFDRLPPESQEVIKGYQVTPERVFAAPINRPKRILFFTNNWNFLDQVSDVFMEQGYEVRFLDYRFVKEAIAQKKKSAGTQILNKAKGWKPSGFTPAQLADQNPMVAELFEWCDVVFCEWLNDAATYLSLYAPQDKKVVLRLHSYEAFVAHPYLANLQRFDGIVFIADHIREVFKAVLGDELMPNCPNTVIANLRNLPALHPAQRTSSALKTLGMTQYASENKDPMFALDILDELRKSDPDWRIRFVGTPWAPNASDAAYGAEFLARAKALGDAVIVDGFTDNIQNWYAQIGFILSTSHREGSHESLVEGMLTGAVPVLRNWPMVAPYGAPQTVFPDLPSINTAKEAATLILNASNAMDLAAKHAIDYASNAVQNSGSRAQIVEFVDQVLAKAE